MPRLKSSAVSAFFSSFGLSSFFWLMVPASLSRSSKFASPLPCFLVSLSGFLVSVAGGFLPSFLSFGTISVASFLMDLPLPPFVFVAGFFGGGVANFVTGGGAGSLAGPAAALSSWGAAVPLPAAAGA